MYYIVEFKGNRRQPYEAPDDLPVEIGRYAIVQAERGEDIGLVKRKAVPHELPEGETLPKLLRLATDDDLERLKFNRMKEEESFRECLRFINKHGLKMKLVDVEYQFDCNKITFYFTAEKRVDFRELVKDLAATFRTRIELRQIGVRDEAKRIGGYGICGKIQCCCSFLNEFKTISTQMARAQNLALNPQKISGNCGRLLCCLRYEQEFYEAMLPHFPLVGSSCIINGAKGTVEKCDLFHEKIVIRVEEEGLRTLKLDEYRRGIKRGWLKVFQPSTQRNQSDAQSQELGAVAE